MALDRRITLAFDTTTVDRTGTPQTTTETVDVWAERLQDNVARTLESQGAYGTASRVYRVRFNPAIVASFNDGEEVRVTDGSYEQVVKGAGEPEGSRRRFLDLVIQE